MNKPKKEKKIKTENRAFFHFCNSAKTALKGVFKMRHGITYKLYFLDFLEIRVPIFQASKLVFVKLCVNFTTCTLHNGNVFPVCPNRPFLTVNLLKRDIVHSLSNGLS